MENLLNLSPTNSDNNSNIEESEQTKKKHICSIICPDLEFLNKTEIITDVVCSVPGCDEIFSQQSALNLHLEKVHKIFQKTEKNELIITRAKSKQQKEQENCNCKYHCPIKDCKYELNGRKSLPTFHSLKNHFIRIHGNKKFKCSKCSKQFAIKSEMERHENNCGSMFKCDVCGANYSTQASLTKHSIKKNHPMPEKKPNFLELSKNQTKIAIKSLNSKQSMINSSSVLLITNTIQNSFIYVPVSNSLNEVNNNSVNKDTNHDNTQRSFACQTNNELTKTQEAGSQTIANSQISYCSQNENFSSDTYRYHSNQLNSTLDIMNEIESGNYMSMNLSSQETQTNKTCVQSISTSTNFDLNHSGTGNDYDCLDAATSTSPFYDIDLFLNNTSTQTQTQQSYFAQTNSSMQTHELLDNSNQQNSNYFCNDLNEYSWIPMNNNSSDQGSNRPIEFSYASSQTDEMYYYNNQLSNLNTNSIQTQTNYNNNNFNNNNNNNKERSLINNNYNVVETQTDWNFSQ